MAPPLYIMGISCFGAHDSAVALTRDGRVIAAVEEERFTRIKHDRSFPYHGIRYCLEAAGISMNDVAHVGYFFQPWKAALCSLRHFAVDPRHWHSIILGSHEGKEERRLGRFGEMLSVKRLLKDRLGYRNPFHGIDHHLCHAASSYFASGFDDAAILTIDGVGELTSTLYATGEGNRIRPFRKILFPQSLGFLYGAVTQYLGYRYNDDEYKVMGLAAYAQGTLKREFGKLVRYNGNGDYTLDLSFFNFQHGAREWYSEKMVKAFGPVRGAGEEFSGRHREIAGGVQNALEETVLQMAAWLREKTGKKNLCLAGGVALNSSLNGKIADSGLFDRIFVQPAAHDSGTSLGAAYAIHHQLLGLGTKREQLREVYLGPDYRQESIEETLQASGLGYQKRDVIERDVARLLGEGKVVGWFQGRMEFGPRALGNRSILGDPRNPKMKDLINLKVKFRESYRPFAPSVPLEYAAEYFDMRNAESPFMLFVYPVRKEKAEIIPAVTHVDNSARVQTVDKTTNLRYWRLLEEFRRATHVPVLLNTSFNLNGEPIVNEPWDAIRTFLNSGIDCLAIGDYLLSK